MEKHTKMHYVCFPSPSHSALDHFYCIDQVPVFVRLCVHARTHVGYCMCVYSLVWDDFEDQVVEQCELLSYLQGRVALKRLSLTVLHGLTQRHMQ